MNTSNLIVLDPTNSLPVHSRWPRLLCSLVSRWHRLLLSAVFLLLACGQASAQLVSIVAWTNGTSGANVATITTFETGLDPTANVLVVGLYGDNSSTYNPVPTFGGVPPTGFQNVSASGQDRLGVAYWFNPNDATTYPNHDIVVNYVNPNGGYYWAYQLSGVNTNAPVFTNGPTTKFASTTSLTNSQYNTLVISFYTINASTAVNALTPNSPLIQCASTVGNLGSGASIASATNNIFAPGIQTISWNSTIGTANQGLGVIGFVAGELGAPAVAASVNPPNQAPSLSFTVTATIYPGYGNVTNVSVDLTPIGGTANHPLVQSSNPNVWTNTFTIPGGAPLGAASLPVTAMQDTAPTIGSGPAQITVVAPTPPTIVNDTAPTNASGFIYVYQGQGVKFSALFTGVTPITNQWQFSLDGITFNDIPGATNTTYTIPSFSSGDQGYYQLEASNPFGSTASSPDLAYIQTGTPAYLWSAPIPFAGLTAEQILTNFPSTDKIAGAMVAKNGGSPITVTLANANNQPVVFAGAGNWAALSGGNGYGTGANTNQTGNANFNTCLNDFYFGNATHIITMGNLVVGQTYQVQLFGLDNSLGNGSRSVTYQDPANSDDQVLNIAMGDNVYVLGTFVASNSVMTIQQNMLTSAGNFNSLVLRTVGWNPPPYFVQLAASVNAFVGTNVSLSALAAGDSTIANPTITYQWAAGPTNGPYVNLTEGSKYAGVTTPTLTISNLIDADGVPVYVLLATDGAGTATTPETHVYVQSLPVPPAANSFAAAVLALTNNKPVGVWILDETNDPSSGLLVAYDYSGKGHSGTYANNAYNGFNGVLAPQPPTFGGFATNQGALQSAVGGTADGNSVVKLPPLNTINGANGVDVTICMWINPSAVVPANTGLIYNRSSVDQCGLSFGGTTGGPSGQENLSAFWANANGEATYNYNPGLYPVNNTWNFVVLVVRTNALTFYLDYVDANGVAHLGKAADTASKYNQQQWGGTTGTPIWLGGDPSGTVFPGRIANAAMFNSALTDDQISTLFSAGYQVAGFPAGIAQQPPAYITNYVGYTVQISAQPGGSSPITNQWMFNGTNLVDGWFNGSLISGSTSNVLTIQNVSTNWQGVYSLAVTNVISGAVSSNSTLVILTPSAPPAGNLVGNWLAGAQNLTDVSGHLPGTHDGSQIVTNGVARGTLVWTNDLPPKNSGGSSLNIVNTGVQINNTSTNDAGYENTFDVGISNTFTVSFWAKGWPGAWNPFVCKFGETTPTPAGGWQVRNDGGNNVSPCFTMRGNPGTVGLGTAVGGNAEDMGATSLTYGNDGKWHFYCATYDLNAGQRMLYVDGSLVAYTTGQGQYSMAPACHLGIGAKDQPPGSITVSNYFTSYYTGRIYDVRIYNVAISGDQQASLAAPPPLPAFPLTATVTQASGGNAGYMDLTWHTGGWLLQSTNAAGPWTTNKAATPTYRVYPTNNPPIEFYKVLFPQ